MNVALWDAKSDYMLLWTTAGRGNAERMARTLLQTSSLLLSDPEVDPVAPEPVTTTAQLPRRIRPVCAMSCMCSPGYLCGIVPPCTPKCFPDPQAASKCASFYCHIVVLHNEEYLTL